MTAEEMARQHPRLHRVFTMLVAGAAILGLAFVLLAVSRWDAWAGGFLCGAVFTFVLVGILAAMFPGAPSGGSRSEVS